ncbi:urea amidolyase family protein [Nesterenkonia massiliensis]|uniref:Urea amidolyase family protein n=1 Tax=Nesterenkonia massiliensis TaxID=1232429 RepID=A0ABT2HRH1_9MICC|nr:urea amidolyase family protein [Nesterenkonia massiliensis]MCT1607299.1 urea amidolyase family protein [Nesterenkonia massiliensis]
MSTQRSQPGVPGSIAEATSSIHRAGTHSLLLEFAELSTVLACHQQLHSQPLPGQQELVAAARTLMIRFAAPHHISQARRSLERITVPELESTGAKEVVLPVIYDGEDLADLAESLNMSPEALIHWHTGMPWTAAFGGFAPGFAYCVPAGQDASGKTRALSIPRRSSPRTAVPAGAVALAGEFSAVYPRVSPGGWQLIGHTTEAMWDLHRATPALLSPGDTVRYEAVRPEAVRPEAVRAETVRGSAGITPEAGDDAAPEGEAGAVLQVTSPGLQMLIQDFGRPGLSDLGVSRAGVADEAAARQANRLAGNRPEAAVLEILNGGASFRAQDTVVLAVTGAEASLVIKDLDGGERPAPQRAAIALVAGDELNISTVERGMRVILAVRGGIRANPVLGSVSADTMSGLGPAPLQTGDLLSCGAAAVGPVGWPEPTTLPEPDEQGRIQLRFTYGPRDDWFSAEEAARLTTQSWTVTEQANRIGIRLAPAAEDPAARPLQRLKKQELPSEGVPRGSLQMPPEGNPVLFLNDHPVTGGYPVMGVILPQDLSAAAQLRPGDTVQLVPVDPDFPQELT